VHKVTGEFSSAQYGPDWRVGGGVGDSLWRGGGTGCADRTLPADLGIPDTLNVLITLVFGFSFRMLALKYDWEMPEFVYKAQPMDRKK